ncbi:MULTISPECIES: flagellin N-terminal helical domain-containing protein [Phyllobacteriaceae]|uniref:Flagellin n=2 Tax=Hyphomicrobiales TaxID=356 RepID=A0ABY2Q8X5_9HYPH|nr:MULTISPECIES: flagellin [Mesorhizobium]QDC00545.1 flagellin [Mesorhizobium sp. 8]THF57880.1 flagellin [Mesorhizobium composti]
MASIMTNASAMTALQSLNATNKQLEQTQSRISTGFRVSTASDNAAYWSIATTMRSDNKANSVVQDALGLGAGKVDTAYTAMNSAIDVIDDIKAKVLLAKTSSAEDRAKIQSEIKSYQDQLRDSIGGATYAGANLLQTDSASTDTTLQVISSYNRDSTGAVVTGSIDIAYKNIRLIDANATASTGILDKAGSASSVSLLDISLSATGMSAITGTGDVAKFDNLLTDIEKVLGKMTAAASELGAAKSRIDMQKDFVSKLMDSIDRGVGQLVDADMNKESTKLQALQVQQQLGIQALSIANTNSQNILALFKG